MFFLLVQVKSKDRSTPFGFRSVHTPIRAAVFHALSLADPTGVAKHPIGLGVPPCKRANPDAAYPRRPRQLDLTRIPKRRTLCNSHANILAIPHPSHTSSSHGWCLDSRSGRPSLAARFSRWADSLIDSLFCDPQTQPYFSVLIDEIALLGEAIAIFLATRYTRRASARFTQTP